MSYWLIKSEPQVYSLEDLQREKSTQWDCIRNYQARNFLRAFEIGDLCLYYYSNASPSAIVGLARCTAKAAADATQFDRKSEYYDPKATEREPRWFAPEVSYFRTFKVQVTLDEIKTHKILKNMVLLNNSRLSVQPVTGKEFEFICQLGDNK